MTEMLKLETSGSAEGWVPSAYAYMYAQYCRRCGAAPGQPCIARRKQSAVLSDPAHAFHTARQDDGIRHYYQDVAAAPDVQDRVLGECYGSVPVPMSTEVTPGLQLLP